MWTWCSIHPSISCSQLLFHPRWWCNLPGSEISFWIYIYIEILFYFMLAPFSQTEALFVALWSKQASKQGVDDLPTWWSQSVSIRRGAGRGVTSVCRCVWRKHRGFFADMRWSNLFAERGSMLTARHWRSQDSARILHCVWGDKYRARHVVGGLSLRQRA